MIVDANVSSGTGKKNPPRSSKKRKLPDFSDLKVLVMDDEKSVLKLLGKTLTQLKCSYVLTEDGSQAIKKCVQECDNKTPFDVAILDLMVPEGVGGLPTAGKMKDICPDTTLVVSSGYANDPVMANYKEYGFAFRLPKPYSLKEFSNLLQMVHNSKKSQITK